MTDEMEQWQREVWADAEKQVACSQCDALGFLCLQCDEVRRLAVEAMRAQDAKTRAETLREVIKKIDDLVAITLTPAAVTVLALIRRQIAALRKQEPHTP